MKISYSDWEGDAAVRFTLDDGRSFGFAHLRGAWKGGLDSEIFAKAKVLTEAEFHRRWPGLALPNPPK